MEHQKVIEAARKKQQVRDAEWGARIREQEIERHSTKELAVIELYPRLRPASVNDYLGWLKGYIEKGGKPSHVYDYPFSRWEWYVAVENIKPIQLYGAQSINIIIPDWVSAKDGDWGHCNLFYMDGYRASNFVPLFKDTNFKD